MHFIIDGYNLMFRVLHADDDLQTQREQIIHGLNEKIQLLHLDVTIIFDAYYQPGLGSRAHYKHLEICFTDEGETADDYIIHLLKGAGTPKSITVITSDNQLAWRARMRLAKTEKVETFLTWLNKKYREKVWRQKPRGLKELSPRSKLPTHQPLPKGPPPSPGQTAEASFDYYLYQFEKKFQDMESDHCDGAK